MQKQHGGKREGAGRPSREQAYKQTSIDVRADLLDWIDEEYGNRRAAIEEALIDLKAKKETEHMATTTALKATLEQFLLSDDFRTGTISSTKAGWHGDSYSVELFSDGTWRVLNASQIGNKYESEGVILRLSALDTSELDEYLEDNPEGELEFLKMAFDAEEDELKADIRERFEY